MFNNNERKVKKYPYMAYSQNLIECFNIIGYMEVHFGEIIKEIKKKPENNNEIIQKMKKQNMNYLEEYKPKINPIIINTISSNIQDGNLIDFDLLIKSIFPSSPSIYFNKNENNKDIKIGNYNVIFYLNIKQKTPIYSFSLIFYEMLQISNNIKIFIPKVFNILTQFPYFIEFNKLFEQIYKLFKINNQEIPLEIMLYNIINFIPSPINHEMLISLFPNKDLISYEKEVSQEKDEKSKPLHNKSNETGNISQLSGYPCFHFKLQEIFKIISIYNIVKLIIYNFIESKIIFFSCNIEILNITMFMFSKLNYPCNDSSSISSIISISKKEFFTNDIKFVGKLNKKFFGVNCKYNKEEFKIKIDNFYSEYFIIDLDNDDLEYFGHNEQIIKLNAYIEKILDDKKINSFFLEKYIKKLYNDFKDITTKVTNTTYGENSEDETPRFFAFDNVYISKNKIIQEKIYDFILNLLSIFHNFFKLTLEKEEKNGEIVNKYNLSYKNEKTIFENWSEEEKIFANFFFESHNWEKYFKNYISNNIINELFTIPYIFSEEFITVKQTGKNIIKYYFDIIDKFYFTKSTIEKVDFNNFYIYYEKNLKNYLFNESKMSKKLKIDYNKNFDKLKIGYKYKITELDQNVLFSYINFIENLEESELLNIFPSINFKNQFKIKESNILNLTQVIQETLIDQKILSNEENICFYCLSIFILICDNLDICEHFEYLFKILKKQTFLIRRIINLMLSILYKLCLHNMQLDYLKKSLLIYLQLMNILTQYNIIPDILLWHLIENFKEIELKYNKMVKDINEKSDKLTPKNYPNDIELKFKTFLRYNFCKDGILNEKYLIELSKKTDLNSNLSEQCQKCNVTITPKIFIKDLSKPSNKYLINLFTPKKIYENSKELIKSFYFSLQKTNEMKISIQENIKNLIFYTNAYNMNHNLQNFLFSLIEN